MHTKYVLKNTSNPIYHERKVRSISSCNTPKELTSGKSNGKNTHLVQLFARKVSFLPVKGLLMCSPFVLFLLKRNLYWENQKQFCLSLSFSENTSFYFIIIFKFEIIILCSMKKKIQKTQVCFVSFICESILFWHPHNNKKIWDWPPKHMYISQNNTVCQSACLFTRISFLPSSKKFHKEHWIVHFENSLRKLKLNLYTLLMSLCTHINTQTYILILRHYK